MSSHLPRASRSRNRAPRVHSSAHMANHTPTSPKRGASSTASVSRMPHMLTRLIIFTGGTHTGQSLFEADNAAGTGSDCMLKSSSSEEIADSDIGKPFCRLSD